MFSPYESGYLCVCACLGICVQLVDIGRMGRRHILENRFGHKIICNSKTQQFPRNVWGEGAGNHQKMSHC